MSTFQLQAVIDSIFHCSELVILLLHIHHLLVLLRVVDGHPGRGVFIRP